MFELCGGVCHERARWFFTMLSRWRQALSGQSKNDSPKGAADFDYFRSSAGSGVAFVAAHHPRPAATAILSDPGAALSWRVKLAARRASRLASPSQDRRPNDDVPGGVSAHAFSGTCAVIIVGRSSSDRLWFWAGQYAGLRYRRWRKHSWRRRIKYAAGSSTAEAQAHARKAATDE